MARGTWWMALATLCLAGLVAFAVEWREREEARDLRAEAERLLATPLTKAATFERIPAARARMLLEDATRLHPDARTLGLRAYATGLDALARGRTERASEALAEAGAHLGNDARLALLQARIAVAAGDTAGARAGVARALALSPDDVRARLMHAELALATAPEATLTVVGELLEREPECGALHNLRGLAEAALGRREEALADFDRALDRDATDPSPYLNRGRVLREAGRHVEAEEAFSQAIARGVGAVDAWLGRGLSRVAQGDLAGGAADLEHARTLAPAEPLPLIALADVEVARGTFPRAIELYRAALVTDPKHAVAWLKLGNTLMRTSDAAGARDAYEHAIQHAPELAAAHNGLGAARTQLGDVPGADAALARAAALDRNDPNPLLNLAALRKRQGDEAGARDAWQGALARGYVR